ncbi:unnamed protein product [Cyprideis torosa]|uniref:Uncharacterized protein n=1 Tax=Cyprideis torosa TaxID=163714 RepID=A0A7R8ZI77_9CRUS|nr:unnamed protein product [Cyprideis torosa]CAG0884194.1 unnamed protein product [Cyprideis torosa]
MPRNKNKGKLKKAVTAPCILEQLDESDVSSEDEYQDEFSPLFRKHQNDRSDDLGDPERTVGNDQDRTEIEAETVTRNQKKPKEANWELILKWKNQNRSRT